VWIFTPFSFLSVVSDRNDPKKLLIRARARVDLENFKALYCKRLGPIENSPRADYPFRARIGRVAFTYAMGRVIDDLKYPNFKSAVTAKQGSVRHDVYMRVWTVMRDAETEGKLDGSLHRESRSYRFDAPKRLGPGEKLGPEVPYRSPFGIDSYHWSDSNRFTEARRPVSRGILDRDHHDRDDDRDTPDEDDDTTRPRRKVVSVDDIIRKHRR